MIGIIVGGLGLALVGYRVYVSVAAVRANRAGDHEREGDLRRNGFVASRSYLVVVLVVVAAGVALSSWGH